MTENEIARLVVDVAYKLHTRLGPGLLETVYEVILAHELRKVGLEVARQVPVQIAWEGVRFDEGFKADIMVNNLVILELKSVETLHPVHAKQLLTYLRVTGLKLGLLINFGERLIKNGIKRVANGLPEEPAA